MKHIFREAGVRVDIRIADMVIFGETLEEALKKYSSEYSEEEITKMYNVAKKRHRRYRTESAKRDFMSIIQMLRKVGLSNEEIIKLFNASMNKVMSSEG